VSTPSRVRFERIPVESQEPIVAFAAIRAMLAAAAVAGLAVLGFPYEGRATAVIAGVILPWTLIALVITRRSPTTGLHAAFVLGDFAVLGVLQAVEPDLYAPTHFVALFLVAAHAHFQGAQRSLAVGVLPAAILIPITVATDVPVEAGLRDGYESVFAAACVSAALAVGALRTAESSGRLRARALSRRAIDTEAEGRRRLAEAIHDGPLQELSSVELMLASAEHALERGDTAKGRSSIGEARVLTRSNISFLRDEVVQLGPYAFEERSLEQALMDCVEVWERRYGFEVEAEIRADDLPGEIAGALFRVAQEAVANAGKHAGAKRLTVRVRQEPGLVTMEVGDDGQGFGDVDPLGPGEPGHIGLASMRERTEMFGGRLDVESGDGRTLVRARIPL
jgi:signal transduction histidine kinase